MSTGEKRRLNGEAEEEDDDDVDGGLDAWERTYTDERSWEALEEDESGLLCPIDNKAIYHAQYRRRLRSLSANAARIQKGLIRFLYIVVDLSRVFLSLTTPCFGLSFVIEERDLASVVIGSDQQKWWYIAV